MTKVSLNRSFLKVFFLLAGISAFVDSEALACGQGLFPFARQVRPTGVLSSSDLADSSDAEVSQAAATLSPIVSVEQGDLFEELISRSGQVFQKDLTLKSETEIQDSDGFSPVLPRHLEENEQSESENRTESQLGRICNGGEECLVPLVKLRSLEGRGDLLKGKRILVFEDNLINQKLANKILTGFGLEVVIVGYGVKGLDLLFSDDRFDFILMDHDMPVKNQPSLNGLECTRLIRSRGLSVPIISLTANTTVGLEQDYKVAGANEFVAKPINITKIEKILKDLALGESGMKHSPLENTIRHLDKLLKLRSIDFHCLPVDQD